MVRASSGKPRPDFRRSAYWIVGGLMLLAAAGVADDAGPEKAPPKFQRPVLIRFHGPIGNLSERFFHRKLEKARQQGADLLIVEIDSPGGLLHTSLDLATELKDVTWARTVAFIPRQALSGAAIMSLGCDEIVIAPDATIGDAGAIFQGRDAMFRHAPEKIRSMLAASVRTLAEAKGRSPALAEAMVDMDLAVYAVKNRNTGQESFLSDHDIASSPDPGAWEKGALVPESRPGLFLTLSGKRAVELTLAQANVRDPIELRERYQLTAEMTVLETNWVDTTVMILNNPFVTGLLFVVGLIAMYVEFCAPGVGVGGLISGLCFMLFFWSRFLGGTSGWLEILLFCTGVVFLLVEVFVLPGFGIAGVTGILLMLTGILMASQDFRPQDGLQPSAAASTLAVVAGSGVLALIGAALVTRYFGGIPFLKQLALPPPADSDGPAAMTPAKPGEKFVPVSTGMNGPAAPGISIHVGDWGVAESLLRPAGKAIFGGEYFDVVTEGSFVDKGRQVRVVQIRGNHIVVREIED